MKISMTVTDPLSETILPQNEQQRTQSLHIILLYEQEFHSTLQSPVF